MTSDFYSFKKETKSTMMLQSPFIGVLWKGVINTLFIQL